MTAGDPERPFGNNPGKKHVKSPGAEYIDNMDIRNAVYLRIVEGMSSRVVELAEEIQENIDREADRPTTVPLGRVGTGIFELHTVTVSFFESASWILIRWAIEADVPIVDELIRYFEHKHRREIFESSIEREKKIDAISSYFSEDGSAYDYMRVFEFSGVIDREFKDLLHEVRIRRNTYVHNPIKILELSTADEVISEIAKCVSVVEGLTELLDNELPVDRAFYDHFGPEEE